MISHPTAPPPYPNLWAGKRSVCINISERTSQILIIKSFISLSFGIQSEPYIYMVSNSGTPKYHGSSLCSPCFTRSSGYPPLINLSISAICQYIPVYLIESLIIWRFPKMALPQVIQVMDDHDLVLKQP